MFPPPGSVVDDDGGAHDVHRAEADQHDVCHEGRVGRVTRQRDSERTVVQCGTADATSRFPPFQDFCLVKFSDKEDAARES